MTRQQAEQIRSDLVALNRAIRYAVEEAQSDDARGALTWLEDARGAARNLARDIGAIPLR
jgi:hypothetical protein